MRRTILILTLSLTVALLGCARTTNNPPDSGGAKSDAPSPWMHIELTDALTGETFKISDFKGTPVLLETFAVWCPTCTKQQREIKKLHEAIGDNVISISVDTDPSEDADKVTEYAERNAFSWRFAIDANDFARELVDEFGVNVVNAPAAPIVLIDEDLQAKLLRFGVKSADELKKDVENGGG